MPGYRYYYKTGTVLEIAWSYSTALCLLHLLKPLHLNYHYSHRPTHDKLPSLPDILSLPLTICKLIISYSIKALSLASCFHSFSFIVARKKFFFRSTVILMEVFNSSSSGPKNSIKKYEVHGKILSATQLSHKAYRLQPNQSATFTRYPIILCLSRMDIFVFIPLKKAFLFLFH